MSTQTKRYFKNMYPPYSSKTAADMLNGENLSIDLQNKVNFLASSLSAKISAVENDLSKGNDFSIYTGYSGIAYMYFMISMKKEDPDLMKKAEVLCKKAITKLNRKRVTYLTGDAGALALSAAVFKAQGLDKESEQMISQLLAMVDKVSNDTGLPDELLYGKAGFLYALLFVNKYVGKDTIPAMEIRKVLNIILHSGKILANEKQNFGSPLMYEWHESYYLGAAHGIAGILYLLLLTRENLSQEELDVLIRPTLDWLITQRHPSNNFKSSLGSTQDKLVQWCHGAPGFVHLYILASQVFNNPEYMKIALECGEVVWTKGLIDKGYSICHGVAGNAYTFIELYKATQDLKQLYRAACFTDWCTLYPSNEGRHPDRPYSLFEGTAGLIYFLKDMSDPSKASFPAYDL